MNYEQGYVSSRDKDDICHVLHRFAQSKNDVLLLKAERSLSAVRALSILCEDLQSLIESECKIFNVFLHILIDFINAPVKGWSLVGDDCGFFDFSHFLSLL